jgi:hypothetical protein
MLFAYSIKNDAVHFLIVIVSSSDSNEILTRLKIETKMISFTRSGKRKLPALLHVGKKET